MPSAPCCAYGPVCRSAPTLPLLEPISPLKWQEHPSKSQPGSLSVPKDSYFMANLQQHRQSQSQEGECCLVAVLFECGLRCEPPPAAQCTWINNCRLYAIACKHAHILCKGPMRILLHPTSTVYRREVHRLSCCVCVLSRCLFFIP